LIDNNTVRSASGGALYLSSVNALVTFSSFEANQGSDQGASAIMGGTDYLGSRLIVLHSNFTFNFSPSYGGAIATIFDHSTIHDCIFSNNWAYGNGGAVFFVTINDEPGASTRARFGSVTDCLFSNNAAMFHEFGRGGALGMEPLNTINPVLTGSALTVENCQFINNTSSVGGALAFSCCEANITNSVFSSNSAVIYGGSIHADTYSTVFINEANFTDSTSPTQWGYVLSCQTDASMTINNCAIVDNNSTVDQTAYGGPVYSAGYLTITNSIIKDNIDEMGIVGAIYITGGVAVVNNTIISNNIAYFIGAIYVSNAQAYFYNSTVADNFSDCVEVNARLNSTCVPPAVGFAGIVLLQASLYLDSSTVSTNSFWSDPTSTLIHRSQTPTLHFTDLCFRTLLHIVHWNSN